MDTTMLGQQTMANIVIVTIPLLAAGAWILICQFPGLLGQVSMAAAKWAIGAEERWTTWMVAVG